MIKQSCRPLRRTVLLLMCATGALTQAWTENQSPDAPRTRGVELFEHHEFEKAVNAFLADLRVNPNSVEALLYLGRIGFEENRLDAAQKHFERVTLLAPDNSAGFHWLGRLYGVQARELGVPRGIGAAIRTRKSLERAVALNPDNLEARADLARFYREAPAFVGGRRRAAQAQIEEIARRDSYLGALGWGDLALGDTKYNAAERQYQAAARLNPLKADAYFRLGMLHQKMGRYDQAFTDFEKTLQIDPQQKTALFQIGEAADLSGQHLERGETALKSYLQCTPFYIMPKLSWAHRRLGNIYLKQGSSNAAREQYLTALRIAPGDSEAADALKQLDASKGR
jgi:tetratricopeptide (TPR) repeat protein